MPEPRLDVLAIGNAVVDIIAATDDGFLTREGLEKGSMRLIDVDEASRLYDHMGPAREVSGGSAGNTAAGVAALGGRAGFIGQVAEDQLGDIYRHDIRGSGVEFETPAIDIGVPTGRVMVLVTPDGQRTMNTFLGAAQHLPADAIDPKQIEDAAILYLEGYLWDPEVPRRAMTQAIEIARSAGRKVAFTLSDSFCVDRHRDGFLQLIDGGFVDILFANEDEVVALTGASGLEGALGLSAKVPVLVVTRSEKGALALAGGERVDVPAEPVAKVVDTTGAGDLFAAGFLAAHARGEGLERSLRTGAIAAAEIISHYGARPEADLMALVKQRLG
ncbi:MAG TPA: adenosine kinase [Allosphingosinicella sp.]|nr:adenosine kinase [Allosphingosinicella sp.]